MNRPSAPLTFSLLSIALIAAGTAVFFGVQQNLPAPAATVIANQITPASLTQGSNIAQGVPQGVDLFALASIGGNTAQQLYALSTFDRTLYRQIFAAQAKNNWGQANALIKRLHDPILVGHILFERYINAEDYKATYAELREWMVSYGDHPDAYKVYQLAQKRRQKDPAELPAPQIAKKLFGSLELSWLSKNTQKAAYKGASTTRRNEAEINGFIRKVKQKVSSDGVTAAYNMLGSDKIARQLTAFEYDSLLSEIASQYYYDGKYPTALKISAQAIQRSGKNVPIAHWIAGLSSWQMKEYGKAARHFELVTQSQSRNPWMLSAGAFWAARSYEKIGSDNLSNDWLREAASYPRTFYGLVAKTRLGSDQPFSWAAPELTQPLVTSLEGTSSGKRALALLDIGENSLAQQELLQTHPNGNQRLEKALVAVAHHFNLTELSMRLGNAINQPDGKLYDVALYPMVPWKGDTTTGVDPALINALIRQESKFDPNAKNESGAKGLMQLMPTTAELVSDKSFNAKDLHNPEVNVALGQRYVRYLLGLQQVDGNLIYLAAAYNAGPGNLSRWQKKMSYNDDPFLFIESIPWSETRAFVARVMTNYWIYGQRLNQEMVTLDSLSDEKWPIYKLPETPGMKLASY